MELTPSKTNMDGASDEGIEQLSGSAAEIQQPSGSKAEIQSPPQAQSPRSSKSKIEVQPPAAAAAQDQQPAAPAPQKSPDDIRKHKHKKGSKDRGHGHEQPDSSASKAKVKEGESKTSEMSRKSKGRLSTQASALSAQEAAAKKAAAKEKKAKERKFRKTNPTKLRVKLPPIESYDKELEYIPDVPGRILIRLERLMGTDRVRITDTKYLKALLKALEGEEQAVWAKRSKLRKKEERLRSRKLAIDGYMEPTEDMADLYKHPVFRVNRILNRLSKLDSRSTMAPSKKLPPITPVEPFEEYEKTGILFGFHANHYLLNKNVYAEEALPEPTPSFILAEEQNEEEIDAFYAKLEEAKAADMAAREGGSRPATAGQEARTKDRRSEYGGEDDEPPIIGSMVIQKSSIAMGPRPSISGGQVSLPPKPSTTAGLAVEKQPSAAAVQKQPSAAVVQKTPSGGVAAQKTPSGGMAQKQPSSSQTPSQAMMENEFEDGGEEELLGTEEDEGAEEGGEVSEFCRLVLMARGSLTSTKEHFGIPPEENLQAKWAPFKSDLVEKVYDEDNAGAAADMYQFAQSVLATYKRENFVAENFVNKELRQYFQ